jgi:uncharacterized coiled-coil protein SlyX
MIENRLIRYTTDKLSSGTAQLLLKTSGSLVFGTTGAPLITFNTSGHIYCRNIFINNNDIATIITKILKNLSTNGDVTASILLRLDGLDSNIIRIDGLISTNTTDIATLFSTTQMQSENIEMLNGQLLLIEGRLSTAEGDITSMDVRISTLETTGTDYAIRITALETLTTNQQSTLNDHSSRISSLETFRTSASSALYAHDLALESLGTRTTNLESRCTTIETTNTNQQSTLNDHSSRISSLETFRTSASSALYAHDLALESLGTRTTNLESRCTTIETTNTNQQNTINDHTNRIVSLETFQLSTTLWRNSMTTWKTSIDTWKNDVDYTLGDHTSSISSLGTRMTSVESINTTQTTNITALQTLTGHITLAPYTINSVVHNLTCIDGIPINSIPNGSYRSIGYPFIPMIGIDGVLEGPKYLDLHELTSTVDNRCRILCNGVNVLKINGAGSTLQTEKINVFNIPTVGTTTQGPSWPSILTCSTTGISDIGRAIDFHLTSGDTTDHTARLECITGGHFNLTNNVDVDSSSTTQLNVFQLNTTSIQMTTTNPSLPSYDLTGKLVNHDNAIASLDSDLTSVESRTTTLEQKTSVISIPDTTWLKIASRNLLLSAANTIQFVNQNWDTMEIQHNAEGLHFINRTDIVIKCRIRADGSNNVLLNNTFLHTSPCEGGLIIGLPCFFNRDRGVFHFDGNQERFVQSDASNVSDVIPAAIQYDQSEMMNHYKDYLGVVTRCFSPEQTLELSSGGLSYFVTIHEYVVEYASMGDVVYMCNDSSVYNVGDQIYLDGSIVDDDVPQTNRLRRSILGTISAKIDSTHVALFI